MVGYRARNRRLLFACADDVERAQGQARLRPIGRADPASRRLRPHDLRPELLARSSAGGSGCPVRLGLLLRHSSAAGNGGWDTHGNNFTQLKNRLLPITDQSVPTLIQDLQARGLSGRDIGRLDGRVRQKPEGSEHHQVWTRRPRPLAVLLHSPLCRRWDHSRRDSRLSDRIGAYPATEPASPDDIAATMFWALGIDPATEVIDTLSRPLPIAAGKPITRLFG